MNENFMISADGLKFMSAMMEVFDGVKLFAENEKMFYAIETLPLVGDVYICMIGKNILIKKDGQTVLSKHYDLPMTGCRPENRDTLVTWCRVQLVKELETK